MSVSRDFIDSYSPEASELFGIGLTRTRSRPAGPVPNRPRLWQHNVSFRFPRSAGFAQAAYTPRQEKLTLPYLGPGTPRAAFAGRSPPRRPRSSPPDRRQDE